jgi:hypothetical protein
MPPSVPLFLPGAEHKRSKCNRKIQGLIVRAQLLAHDAGRNTCEKLFAQTLSGRDKMLVGADDTTGCR